MPAEEFKLTGFPGLNLGEDPVNTGAAVASNVDLAREGELSKRGGYRRLNHIRYNGAITCIPDLQRICDYGRLLVCSDDFYEHGYVGPNPPPPPHPTPPPPPVIDDNWPPVAFATASETEFEVAFVGDVHTVRFSGGGSYDPDGSIAQYRWDFDDGTYGYGRTIDHEFTVGVDKTYNVTLTVTDNDGDTDSYTVQVTATVGILLWALDFSKGQGPASTGRPYIAALANGDPPGTTFVLDAAQSAINQNVHARWWERTGAAAWTYDSMIGWFHKWADYRPRLSYFGGSYYAAMKAAIGANTAFLHVYNGAAWVQIGTYAGANGCLFELGGSLWWVLMKAAVEKRVYEVVGGAPVLRNTLPYVGVTGHTGPVEFDGAMHTSEGYYTLSGGGLAFTAVALNKPYDEPNAIWNGVLYQGAGANVLRYKTATGAGWNTLNIPPDPDTGETYDLREAGVYAGLMFLRGTRASDGAECLLQYNGGYLKEEYVVPAADTPFAFYATPAGIWFSAYDNPGGIAHLYKRND